MYNTPSCGRSDNSFTQNNTTDKRLKLKAHSEEQRYP